MSFGDTSLEFQGAGALIAAFGAFAGAQGQASTLRAQADIDSINASTAEAAARAALFAGQRQEQQSELATANLKDKQILGYTSGNVDIGEGSAARTLTSTDVLGKIDANTIAANAVRQAWGYRTQAVSLQGDATRKTASADSISPWTVGSASLLQSAGSVASNWYSLDKAGGLDALSSKNFGKTSFDAYWKP